jgi:hypothetical protein
VLLDHGGHELCVFLFDRKPWGQESGLAFVLLNSQHILDGIRAWVIHDFVLCVRFRSVHLDCHCIRYSSAILCLLTV